MLEINYCPICDNKKVASKDVRTLTIVGFYPVGTGKESMCKKCSEWYADIIGYPLAA